MYTIPKHSSVPNKHDIAFSMVPQGGLDPTKRLFAYDDLVADGQPLRYKCYLLFPRWKQEGCRAHDMCLQR